MRRTPLVSISMWLSLPSSCSMMIRVVALLNKYLHESDLRLEVYVESLDSQYVCKYPALFIRGFHAILMIKSLLESVFDQ